MNSHLDTDAKGGDAVIVGNDVAVTIVGVRRNQIRIGISAPRNVSVHPKEIYERIRREQHPEPLT